MWPRRLSEGRWEAVNFYCQIGVFPSFWQALKFTLFS
jgi:hypothetical protein